MSLCREDAQELIDDLKYDFDESVAEELDRKVWPLFEKVSLLKPGDYRDPAVSQLFNCLVDPEFTVEEFNYVVGFMGLQVFNKSPSPYLHLVVAEALAVKSTILVGLWEHATWFLTFLGGSFSQQEEYLSEGLVSDRLNDWIINVMGDTHLCPNPYLRFEFIREFSDMVSVTDHNRTQALESFVSASSILNTDCNTKSMTIIGCNIWVAFEQITGINCLH